MFKSHLACVFVSSAALMTGCGDYDAESAADEATELDLGTLSQPLCENKGGTNAVMTGLAVAAGRELRRWLPERDFRWNSSKGMLELTATGSARCPNSACVNIQALLDMQKPEASGKVTFPGNIRLDSALLRQKLKTAWSAQASCTTGNGCASSAELRYAYVENGSCDKKFFFDPLKAGTSTMIGASAADKLKNNLRFVGYPDNKMLNFYVRDGQVSVDPTYGLNEGVTASLGNCDVACTKVTRNNMAGRCCSCNGASRKYVRAMFNAATYLCSG